MFFDEEEPLSLPLLGYFLLITNKFKHYLRNLEREGETMKKYMVVRMMVIVFL